MIGNKKIEFSLLNNISKLFILVSFPWIIIFYLLNQPFLSASVIPFTCLFGVSFILNKKKQTITKHLLLLTGTLALTFYALFLGETANVQLIYFPLFVSIFMLFSIEEKKSIILWIIIFLISFIGIEFIFNFKLFTPINLADYSNLIIQLLMTFIAIFLLIAEIITFLNEIKRLYKQNEYYKIKTLNERLNGIKETLIALNHTINNSLVSIIAGSKWIQINYKNDEKIQKQIVNIYENGQIISNTLKKANKIKMPKSTEYVDGISMLDIKNSE